MSTFMETIEDSEKIEELYYQDLEKHPEAWEGKSLQEFVERYKQIVTEYKKNKDSH